MMRSATSEEMLRFYDARRRVIGEEHETVGVGGLCEKAMHKILKLYVEPREDFHEIKYLGSVADVKNGEGIFEIQTRSIEKLAPRLLKYLADTSVTVVMPVIVRKRVSWIDPETGELSKPHTSPRRESVYTAFRELYKIRRFLSNPRLFIRLVYLNADEYKYLDGWDRTAKRGATRLERIPTALLGEELISFSDYADFVPFEDGAEFTAKELCTAAGFKKKITSYVIGLLTSVGAIEFVRKQGRAFVYRKIPKSHSDKA